MTAAGQAGFLRTGDPKGSFFLGDRGKGSASQAGTPRLCSAAPGLDLMLSFLRVRELNSVMFNAALIQEGGEDGALGVRQLRL